MSFTRKSTPGDVSAVVSLKVPTNRYQKNRPSVEGFADVKALNTDDAGSTCTFPNILEVDIEELITPILRAPLDAVNMRSRQNAVSSIVLAKVGKVRDDEGITATRTDVVRLLIAVTLIIELLTQYLE